ncbi:peptidoglycan D,D-transpeptidase FtsI family protein [Patescibacteria group bacterium]
MWRSFVVFLFIIFLYLITIVRLFYIQILSDDQWKKEAEKQHYIRLSLPAQRGEILDINKNTIVNNQPAYLVYAQPQNIANLDSFVSQVEKILPFENNGLVEALHESERVWVPLSHKTKASKIDELKNLELKGLGFENDPTRFYPESSMAAHLLGFVGMDINGQDKGYFGIEGYYDRELKGKDGSLLQEKDVHGNPIVIGQAKRVAAQDGRSLTLWVDRSIQKIAEEKLAQAIKKYGASEGSVLIYDPKTGGVIAMATHPYYDPQKYNIYSSDIYKNPIVSSSYEPGSTFKVLVMSAAIEEKLVKPQTLMDESGPVKIGQYYIKTWNDTYHGSMSMTDVLLHSSNVGMVYVARKLGIEKMINYIDMFGFGNVTNIDLEEESTPEIRAKDNWKEIDLATASFGQGIAVTPIQMVRAVGAIANDGRLMKPMVVKEIVDNNGKVHAIKPKKITQVISPSTARIMTEMMITAVEKGEAKWAKPKGYRIAGKTGTAQIPVSGHYDNEKTIASFIGFAPADDPKFVMLVALREPTSSPWGSETAAPLFFSIAEDLFSYYGIPPL